jgi:preprotein translocase subunit YajC
VILLTLLLLAVFFLSFFYSFLLKQRLRQEPLTKLICFYILSREREREKKVEEGHQQQAKSNEEIRKEAPTNFL